MALTQRVKQTVGAQNGRKSANAAARSAVPRMAVAKGVAARRAAPSNPLVVPRAGVAAAEAPAKLEEFATQNKDAYFTRRHEIVQRHFPTSLGVEDFTSRVEIALSAFGFNGNNSIGEYRRVCSSSSSSSAMGV